MSATLWPAGMSEVVVMPLRTVCAGMGCRAIATLSLGWRWTSWEVTLTRLG